MATPSYRMGPGILSPMHTPPAPASRPGTLTAACVIAFIIAALGAGSSLLGFLVSGLMLVTNGSPHAPFGQDPIREIERRLDREIEEAERELADGKKDQDGMTRRIADLKRRRDAFVGSQERMIQLGRRGMWIGVADGLATLAVSLFLLLGGIQAMKGAERGRRRLVRSAGAKIGLVLVVALINGLFLLREQVALQTEMMESMGGQDFPFPTGVFGSFAIVGAVFGALASCVLPGLVLGLAMDSNGRAYCLAGPSDLPPANGSTTS